MFLYQRKKTSLEQLQERKRQLMKSNEQGFSFIYKMLLIGFAFLIASVMSKDIWEALFNGLSRCVDCDKTAQFVVNMTLYIMPWFFEFISIGFIGVAVIVSLMSVGCYYLELYTLNKRIKKRQQAEESRKENPSTPSQPVQYQQGGAVSVLDLHHKAAALAGHANTAYWGSLMCAFGDEAHARGFIVLTIDEYQQQIVTWEIEDLDAQDKSHLGCTVIKARQKLFSPTIAPDIVDRMVTTGTEDGYNTYWADTILNALEKEGLVMVKTTNAEPTHN